MREEVRSRLRALGFDAVRFARAAPAFGDGLQAWLAAGNHADMAWIERGAEKRSDPELVLPGVRTMIMLGVNYGRENGAPYPAENSRPAWARYAQYSDYHDSIRDALAAAGKILEEVSGIGPDDHRYYVDTGPVLERGWAARSGLGFTGKNAMLISREFGNWLFLACILTRLDLPPDDPLPGKPPVATGTHAGQLCGKCTRCMDACPTDAFTSPGVIDSRRCVSYQTIENKGIIPRDLRPGIGARIYGCDTCLEVCPWNRFAQASREILLTARPEISRLTLVEVLALTPESFSAVFRHTAIKRVKWAGLLRNACIVAGNTRAVECVETLARLAKESVPLVRAHAVWALARLGEAERLRAMRPFETDEAVLAEYRAEGL